MDLVAELDALPADAAQTLAFAEAAGFTSDDPLQRSLTHLWWEHASTAPDRRQGR